MCPIVHHNQALFVSFQYTTAFCWVRPLAHLAQYSVPRGMARFSPHPNFTWWYQVLSLGPSSCPVYLCAVGSFPRQLAEMAVAFIGFHSTWHRDLAVTFMALSAYPSSCSVPPTPLSITVSSTIMAASYITVKLESLPHVFQLGCLLYVFRGSNASQTLQKTPPGFLLLNFS